MGLWGGPRKWVLYNLDTDEKMEGQFVAESVSAEVGGTWSERYALNRQHGILQFVHGNSETVSFRARFFMTAELLGIENDPLINVDTLKKWTRRDSKLARPPLLQFWVGDGHLGLTECILERLSGIEYKEPAQSGVLRDVSFTVNLRQWWPYDVQVEEGGETRYHRSKRKDYYEMLCFREYGDPDKGDIIRKRHPTKPVIEVGDVIKLPSADVIATLKAAPSSLALQTAYGAEDTPQRLRRKEIFELRNVVSKSNIVLEY
jgi:hypothetical protein